MAVFLILNLSSCFSLSEIGLLSFNISPSLNSIIRVAYSLASSGLCVTIITNLSFAISLIKSIICLLVLVSRAPVGSSARIISGLLTRALAIATLCIWPPDNWLGFLWIWFISPTFSKAWVAILRLFFLLYPLSIVLISTFSKILIWLIKL